MFGRTRTLNLLRNEYLPLCAFTGSDDRAWKTFSSDHPRRIASEKAFLLGAGISYVTAMEPAFRMSKSDGPRFCLMAVGKRTFPKFPNNDPADAVSMECDHV